MICNVFGGNHPGKISGIFCLCHHRRRLSGLTITAGNACDTVTVPDIIVNIKIYENFICQSRATLMHNYAGEPKNRSPEMARVSDREAILIIFKRPAKCSLTCSLLCCRLLLSAALNLFS